MSVLRVFKRLFYKQKVEPRKKMTPERREEIVMRRVNRYMEPRKATPGAMDFRKGRNEIGRDIGLSGKKKTYSRTIYEERMAGVVKRAERINAILHSGNKM
jgi:hypothetical protein